MGTKTLRVFILSIIGGITFYANADEIVVGGKIEAVYADPSDVVVQLDHFGDCSKFVLNGQNSKFFHLQRTRTNFKEMTALVLTALAAGKSLTLFVETCAGDRNIVSHIRVNN